MQYVKQTNIAAPPATVFRFHESPEALERLIPPWENMRVAESDGSLAVGSRVVLRGRVGCLPVKWIAEHREFQPPHVFADEQIVGPFKHWYHRHIFEDDGEGGTLLRDEVEYAPPLGWLGMTLGGRFIRRKLERMFTFRHETTKRLIESGEWSPGPARVAAASGVTSPDLVH